MMKRRYKLLLGLLVVLAVAVAAGPRVQPQALQLQAVPPPPQDPAALQAWVDAREGAAGIRPDNQARIVWADPAHPAHAGCAIVYLHGFSASQGEGAPTHRRLAQAFGCNLYLSRLPGHGLDAADAMRGLDVQQLVQASAQALAIGHALGDKVIVIGTSMGGSLALELAAREPQAVDALVLWSPLVRERNNALAPMLWPWGATWLRYSRNHGSEVVHGKSSSDYWAADIHLDGYRTLAALTRGEMQPATFALVRAPVFLGYYYRDEEHQDPTVSVPAMLAMYDQLCTPAALKRKQDFPNADAHVIASPLRSHASDDVFAATRDFLQQVVGLAPVAR